MYAEAATLELEELAKGLYVLTCHCLLSPLSFSLHCPTSLFDTGFQIALGDLEPSLEMPRLQARTTRPCAR